MEREDYGRWISRVLRQGKTGMNAKQPITHDGRHIYDADGRVVYRCSDIAWIDGRVLRQGKTVQLSRIIRIRPMIPTGWSITCTVEFDESIVNRQAVIDAATEAGSIIGLGDWRPKFGRFTVEVL